MKFGAHVSIRNGYLGAAKLALQMNAKAFQYFPKNPRSLTIKKFNREDALLCKQFCEVNGIESVSHSPYPTSLTPLSEKKKLAVIQSLLNDLEIADACGSRGVVVHFGKQMDENNPLVSYQVMIAMLNEILEKWSGKAKILLENNAGKPGTIGTTFEELVQIRKLTDYPEKIGFCFDTCHAFASGLWDGTNWSAVLKKGIKLDYFNELTVIHLNNSKYGTRSGKDRHAPIFNHGHITETQFNELITTTELVNIPFILETPKEEVCHQQEIQSLLKRWGEM